MATALATALAVGEHVDISLTGLEHIGTSQDERALREKPKRSQRTHSVVCDSEVKPKVGVRVCVAV